MRVIPRRPDAIVGFGDTRNPCRDRDLRGARQRGRQPAADPKSGELGGAVRVPAGRSIEFDLADLQFDAAKITVPTLVIRGDADTDATREDNQQLMEALGSTAKEYVEIPGGGHFLHFEKVNTEFYQAVQNFLEAEK